MLPPIEPAVATANPKFDALYQDLCTNRLNTDGSSRLDAKAQKEHDALQHELRKARVEAATNDRLRGALQEVAYHDNELPDELLELITIIVAVLEERIPSTDAILLQDDIEKFTKNVRPIAKVLSQRLERDATTLSRVLNPEQPPSPDTVPKTITKLKDATREAQLALAERRRDLAHNAAELHALYRQIIEAAVRILERTIHGSVARGSKAQADYLSLVAEGMSKKLSIQHSQLLQQLYTTEMNAALKARSEELAGESRNMKRKIAEAEEKLKEYSKIGGMQGMAEEYAEIMKETEKIQKEVARLEQSAV